MGFRGATDSQDARDRVEYWRQLVNSAVVPVEPMLRRGDGPPGAFRAGIAVEDLAEARIAMVTAGAHQVRRSQRLVEERDDEVYTLFAPASGAACQLTRGGRRELLSPGDLTLLDSGDCYELAFDGDHRVLAVTFPRRLLPLPGREVSSLTATRLGTRHGAGALLRPFLFGLARQAYAGAVSEAASFRLADTLVGLTETLLLERLGDPRRASAPRRVLMLAIQRDIESRLGSPDLSPRQIAARHHISSRYLHMLFEAEGVSVSDWIRRRRLERCRRDLRDPALAGLSVAAIGARWGLRDASHFSRVFKAAFDSTPLACRRQPDTSDASHASS